MRAAALGALRLLVEAVVSGDALAFFVPGLVSGLGKALAAAGAHVVWVQVPTQRLLTAILCWCSTFKGPRGSEMNARSLCRRGLWGPHPKRAGSRKCCSGAGGGRAGGGVPCNAGRLNSTPAAGARTSELRCPTTSCHHELCTNLPWWDHIL